METVIHQIPDNDMPFAYATKANLVHLFLNRPEGVIDFISNEIAVNTVYCVRMFRYTTWAEGSLIVVKITGKLDGLLFTKEERCIYGTLEDLPIRVSEGWKLWQ